MNFRLSCASLGLWLGAASFTAVGHAQTPRQQLTALESDPAAKPGAELLAKARAAFTRADRLRGVGDAIRAKLVESTAETWTQAAQALRELGALRKRADVTERQAHDAEESLSRARAALEASFAREQSLNEQLDKATPAPRKSAEVKNAAAPKGGAVPPKPAPKKPALGGKP